MDKSGVAAGASGTPGGLVNPATGRRAKKSWKAEDCYNAISSNLEKVQRTTRENFYAKNGLLRPALLEKMARKMYEQHQNTCWPEGWCQWKSEAEIKEMHPGISCVDGGLWLPIGLSVNVKKYLIAYKEYLTEQGVDFYLHNKPEHIHKSNKWQVDLEPTTISTKHIVFAMGRHTFKTYYWDWLPLKFIKGQVAIFRSTNPLSFDHSISSLGYMARLGDDHTFVQGSTYEHDFNQVKTDKEGEEYLRKRLRRTLPALEDKVETVDQWAGVRTSTPDYKPILGRHPVHSNLHVFTGLGSKGLLYGKFLANHYGEYLTGETNLYPEVDIARFEIG